MSPNVPGSASRSRDVITVYSCVAGGYDRALPAVQPEEGVNFICFTDSPKLRAPGWTLLPLDSPPLGNGHFINRYHKLFPHRLFPETDWSIYIDGNIDFLGRWRSLIEPLANSSAVLAAFSHPDTGRTLVEEFEACKKLKFKKRDFAVWDRQLAFYEKAGVATDQPITTNYLLVRNHLHPKLPDTMSLWWAQLFEWTHRDQLSLPYALHQNNVSALFLDREGGIDPTLLSRARHVPAGIFGVIKAKLERRRRKAIRKRRKRESEKAQR